jgi:hypothetical protein
MLLVCPVWTDTTAGFMVTLTGGLGTPGALKTVIEVVAVLVLSATDVAVIITALGFGACAGAV